MGQRNGHHEVTYPNGDKYIGDFKDGKREGNGVYISKSQHRYEGQWLNDQRHGKGSLFYARNSKAPANQSGQAQSEGQWAGSYEGDWRHDLKHGKGVFTYPNGDKYDGSWKRGKKNGFGEYIYSTKERYHGEFKDDNMNGKGTFYFANGDQLEGQWVEDQTHGRCVRTCANGDRFEEIYDNGSKVSSKPYTAEDAANDARTASKLAAAKAAAARKESMPFDPAQVGYDADDMVPVASSDLTEEEIQQAEAAAAGDKKGSSVDEKEAGADASQVPEESGTPEQEVSTKESTETENDAQVTDTNNAASLEKADPSES